MKVAFAKIKKAKQKGWEEGRHEFHTVFILQIFEHELSFVLGFFFCKEAIKGYIWSPGRKANKVKLESQPL